MGKFWYNFYRTLGWTLVGIGTLVLGVVRFRDDFLTITAFVALFAGFLLWHLADHEKIEGDGK